jgi:hypothetical protein
VNQIIELTAKTASRDLARGPSCLFENTGVHQLGSLVIGDQSDTMALLGELLRGLPEEGGLPCA